MATVKLGLDVANAVLGTGVELSGGGIQLSDAATLSIFDEGIGTPTGWTVWPATGTRVGCVLNDTTFPGRLFVASNASGATYGADFATGAETDWIVRVIPSNASGTPSSGMAIQNSVSGASPMYTTDYGSYPMPATTRLIVFIRNGANIQAYKHDGTGFTLLASATGTLSENEGLWLWVNRTGDVWTFKYKGTNAGSWTTLGTSYTFAFTHAFVSLYLVAGSGSVQFDRLYTAATQFSSSSPTATFTAETAAGTLDPSTAQLTVLQRTDVDYRFATLAESSDRLTIAYRDGSGAYSSEYTVAAFKALGTLTFTTGPQFRVTFVSDGTQQIRLIDPCVGTWTAAVASTPASIGLALTATTETTASFVVSGTAGGTVRLYYRPVALPGSEWTLANTRTGDGSISATGLTAHTDYHAMAVELDGAIESRASNVIEFTTEATATPTDPKYVWVNIYVNGSTTASVSKRLNLRNYTDGTAKVMVNRRAHRIRAEVLQADTSNPYKVKGISVKGVATKQIAR